MDGGRQQARGGGQALLARPAAWDLHFGADQFEPDDRGVLLIRDLAEHFASAAGWQQLLGAVQWHSRTLLDLDWQQLVQLMGSRDLQEAMLHAPAEALSCIACAAYEVGGCCAAVAAVPAPFAASPPQQAAHCAQHPHPNVMLPFTLQVLFRVREAATRQQLPGIQQPCRVLVRLANHPDAFRAISAIKADSIGRLVSVRGTVVRATTTQPVGTELEFVCGKCGAAQRVAFPDGRFAAPATCTEHGCRSRTFVPNKSASACIDWQRVGLQVRRGAGAAALGLQGALAMHTCGWESRQPQPSFAS